MKKLIIQILLAGLIIFLGYKCYNSIMIPQRFTEIKKQRYEKIIQRLKDIRTAQDAYKGVYGKYTGNFDTLIYFIKFDSVKVVRSIGALSDDDIEKGITEAQAIKDGTIIRDTVKVSALENVFGKDYAADDLRYIPFTKKKYQFKMGASSVFTDSGVEVPIFEARISNMEIFEDIRNQYNDQLLEENGERMRLNKYPGLKVGDLKEANNNAGNWE
ncbi:MAG: hypothetical protein RR137_08605 [Odoribacter sp.]